MLKNHVDYWSVKERTNYILNRIFTSMFTCTRQGRKRSGKSIDCGEAARRCQRPGHEQPRSSCVRVATAI